MVQPPALTPARPPGRRGRPPNSAKQNASQNGGTVTNPLPQATFTSSLSFKVKGARPKSPSPPRSSAPAQSTGSQTPNLTPGLSPMFESKRAPRKSKTDAMVAITARSVSPSESASKNSLGVNGTDQTGGPRASSASAGRGRKKTVAAEEPRGLDMTGIRMPERRIDPPRTVARPFGLEDCPVYYPTMDEFKDPMKYVRSISQGAAQYGICKVIPPEGWNMPFVTDTKTFRFKTRLQRLNSIEASSRAKLNFLEQLYRFHQQQEHVGPTIPTINHKPVDLWLLRKEVHIKGGYEAVTRDKQWGDMSRIMGYETGAGISSQLKNAYQRIILPFEEFQFHIRNSPTMAATLNPTASRIPPTGGRMSTATGSRMGGRMASRMSNTSSVPQSTTASGRRQSTPLSAASSGLSEPPEDSEIKGAVQNDIKIEVIAPEDIRLAIAGSSKSPSMPDTPLLQPTPLIEKPAHYVQGDTCEVCHESDRGTEMLLCDGCDNGYHIFCLDPPLASIPRGQWFCHVCLFDTGADYGFDEGEEHSLGSFHERDQAFRLKWFESHPPPPSTWEHPYRAKLGEVNVSEDDVENEFWRLVQSQHETVEIEYGADVHSTTHGSAMPSLETHPLDPYSRDGWNLNNLPIVSDSLLRYVKSDISGMTVPWTYVGMVFSTFCWHNEDHYTYSINYMHWGETKTWYAIPGEDADKFEAAIRSEAPDLFDAQPDLLFQLVTLMSPARLRKAGVRVYACNQRPGEFVITFPQAYHAGFNHGLNFNEAVNFAVPDWLTFGRDCVRRYQEHQKLPVFSHEELLITITQHSDTIKTALWVLDGLKEMVNREIERRNSIRQDIPGLTEVLDDRDRQEEQYQCAVCKGFCYLTQVTCDCTKYVACLDHWTQLCSCPNEQHVLRSRFSDEQLTTILAKVTERSTAPDRWRAALRKVLMESARPDLDALRKLVVEAEEMAVPLEEYPDLKRFVDKAEAWVAAALDVTTPRALPTAKKFLSRRTSNPHENMQERDHKPEFALEDVQGLLREADTLAFTSTHIDNVKGVAYAAEGFERTATHLLEDMETNGTDPTLNTGFWEMLFNTGYALNLHLEHLPRVEKVIKRIRLIQELQELDDHALTLDDVHELQRFATEFELPKEQPQAVQLDLKAQRGETWCKDAKRVLGQEIPAIDELNALVSPPPSVPVIPALLEQIDAIRARAREMEKEAKAILGPPIGRRTAIEDALALVARATKEFSIPAITTLNEDATAAAQIERVCIAILAACHNPSKPIFEELRDMRHSVQTKLWKFVMANFEAVDLQLVQHDTWLEKLPWYRSSEPAMQGQRIVEDVSQNTRPEDDKAPDNPYCTCICATPVIVSAERPSDAVQCDHCQARFHSSCIEGSCPFCDHHHWNGAIPKARSFQYHDLLPLARQAPELTRNYSLAWKHLEVVTTHCNRLTRSIDGFLGIVSEPSGTLELSAAIAQIRHYLRKLYKIQFSIRPRPDLPAYGLTLAHLHRTLATNKNVAEGGTAPNSTAAPNAKKRANRRPKFIFKVEEDPQAIDGSRCFCKGSHVGHRHVMCNTCCFKYHGICVAYDESRLPGGPNSWKCPMCYVKKGKQYPQSAVRVHYHDDRDPEVYVDTKMCLDTYSWQLIRHRLPPPSEPTIVIELARFIPGSNQPPSATPGAPPEAPQATPAVAGPSTSRSSSRPATNGAAAATPASSSSRRAANHSQAASNSPAPSAPKAKAEAKRELPPVPTPSQSSSQSQPPASSAPAATSTVPPKRKAESGGGTTGETGRRLKLVFREGEKVATTAAASDTSARGGSN